MPDKKPGKNCLMNKMLAQFSRMPHTNATCEQSPCNSHYVLGVERPSGSIIYLFMPDGETMYQMLMLQPDSAKLNSENHMKNPTRYQPLERSDEGRFNTAGGRVIDLNYPTEAMICIDDIARSLSHICRFGGHVNQFYSVAEHSLLVMALVPDHLKPYALLHDAAEAYLGDVIKPLKNEIGDRYELFEQTFMSVICRRYGLTEPHYLEHIKPFDTFACNAEHQYLQLGNQLPVRELINSGKIRSFGMSPEAARVRFLLAFSKLFPEHYQATETLIDTSDYLTAPMRAIL